MHRRPLRVAWLAALLLVGIPALGPPASGHPFHLMIENAVTSGSSNQVDTNDWVGQSFVPGTSFLVTRVALWVEDRGPSDPLRVSIRNAGAGVPGTTTLASGFGDGPPFPDWLNIDVNPNAALSAGVTYWIVANSSSSNGNGYDWWDSNDDLAYLPGTAVNSNEGIFWSPAGKDYSFRVYGYEQPSLSFSASASSPTVAPGASITFRANVTNAGPGTSPALWVNVTLPAELTYTGDDAALIGGVRSGTYSFAFTNVAPGSYAFNVTARAPGGAADGTVVQTRLAFQGADHLGVPSAPDVHDLPVTLSNARLTLSLTSSASNVDPGDRIVLNATVTNVGSESALAVVVDATVDANATYVNSTAPGTYNGGTRNVTWNLGSLGPSVTTVVSWSVDAPLGSLDLATITSGVRVRYEDITGVPLADRTATATATIHTPVYAPALRLDRTTAQAATEVIASVDYNNTGSASSLRVWLNWSLDGHYQLIALTPALPFTTTSAGFDIALTNVAPGPHGVSARLRVLRRLDDGLVMGMQVSYEATDGNGNALPSTPLGGTVELLAPSLSVVQSIANGTVSVGSLFDLDVVVENAGQATANAWLNLTLPAEATYVADNGTFVVTTAPGRVSWRILSVPAGTRIHLAVTLRGSTAATTSFRFALDFTDAAGSPALNVLSNAVAVQFIGTGPPGDNPGEPWPWWLALLGVALAVPPVLFLARKRGHLEEVFLVGFSGILLAHLSNTIKSERDRDLLTGMLTAVQDFIRESFATSAEGGLQRMDFGERTINIHRGGHSYLAAVVRGRTPFGLRRKMEETLRKLEDKYTNSLLNGTVDGRLLDGAGELLSKEMLGR